jgi:methyl-accepting chemotaxis protein
MFSFARNNETGAKLAALDRVQAVIEFDLAGNVLHANPNFLAVMGYALGEIQGRHHSLFVEPAHRESAEYREFWTRLGAGEFKAGQFKRLAKGGREVWIEASYNPILDRRGRPYKVVKFATNITKQKHDDTDRAGQISAIGKSQAVIEFTPDGTILNANDNFLGATGYTLDEIRGKHHSIFVEPAYRQSPEYAAFWQRLKRGEYDAAQYKRIAKDGREIWIQASYNPIFDPSGQPYKIVKFATDITQQKTGDADRAGQVAAIRKSQAVIEFTLGGIVVDANENFCAALGYSLDEIKGKHHGMFVDPAYKASAEYAEFWESLKRGEYQAAQYRRIGKGGREIWIEASYNPILDPSGRPYKVVKFATDITKEVKLLADLRQMIDQNFSEIDQAVARSAQESESASGAAASTSENVQAMAAASEELASSVSEIAESMNKSRVATDSAFDQAKAASELTSKLSGAADSMGGIIGLIQDIAAQINLLALNATIESARAGEAGRGFAVVAQEIKTLASQAAKATERIAAEINDVQTVSGDVVNVLASIKGSVEIMRENVLATSTAVEEQNAVTRDMSANMHGTAQAVTAISSNIAAISAAVTQVSAAVSTTRDAAKVLAR